MFGDSDFYSHGMSKQGWQAHDLITNCNPLQDQWARENDYTGDDPIWLEQIRRYEPDVVYAQGIWLVNDDTYPVIKEHCKLIVGQLGSVTNSYKLDKYDVIFTAIAPYVDRFREAGVSSYYLPLAFEPRVLDRIKKVERDIPLSYVGHLHHTHHRRKDVLKHLFKKFGLQYWVGEKWGLDMFEIMARSYIAANCNIDVEPDYVGNMRMYEATGCGALLLMNYGSNLGELFKDDEILIYHNPDEAVELVGYCLEHKEEGEAIAARGQARTLKDHTYDKRMAIIADVLKGML